MLVSLFSCLSCLLRSALVFSFYPPPLYSYFSLIRLGKPRCVFTSGPFAFSLFIFFSRLSLLHSSCMVFQLFESRLFCFGARALSGLIHLLFSRFEDSKGFPRQFASSPLIAAKDFNSLRRSNFCFCFPFPQLGRCFRLLAFP